jgi:hypothetical protein
MSVVTPCVSPLLVRALAARLRDAIAAGDQLASFAFTEGAPAPGPELRDGEELGAAHDFLLRVLQGVSDPLNWRVLAAVVSARGQPEEPDDSGAALSGEAGRRAGGEPEGGLPLDALADLLELPRLAVTERVNAMIQLGLMGRDLEHDSIAASPAGVGLFELICELDAEIAGWLSKRRRA